MTDMYTINSNGTAHTAIFEDNAFDDTLGYKWERLKFMEGNYTQEKRIIEK